MLKYLKKIIKDKKTPMSAKKKAKTVTKKTKSAAKKKAVTKKPVAKKKTPPTKKVKKKVAKKSVKTTSTPVKTKKKTTTKAVKKVKKASPKTQPGASSVKKKAPTKKVAKKASGPAKKASAKKAKATTAAKPNQSLAIDKVKPSKTNKMLKPEASELAKKDARALVLGARKRTSTPAIFKIKARKNTPVLFTLEDVQSIIKSRKDESAGANKRQQTSAKTEEKVAKKKTIDFDAPQKNQVFGAASLIDILGYNPKKESSDEVLAKKEAAKIPSKYQKYYKALVELRTHFKQGLDLHTKETLKKSSKDESGDLSSYGQHMADAGTDSFDRDFALSLVSNEQEALFEIEEAVQRIIEDNYGVCEITGKPIARERLMAVPFTRYSLEGQKQLEKQNRRKVSERAGVFADASAEDAAFVEDSDDD